MARSIFFPSPPRDFKGDRWVRIALRTVHLAAMGLLVGGVARGDAIGTLPWPLWGTVVSGVLFVAMELHHSCVFLLQLKGLAVLVKAMLLVGAVAAPDAALALLLLAIGIGGISSHMPGRYRYYSPWHGRELKAWGPP